MDANRHYILGISGASGIILGFKAIQKLLEYDETIIVHAIITKDARYTAFEEMGKAYPTNESMYQEFSPLIRSRLHLYNIRDFSAKIASGTFITEGMAIVPCSMATLGAVALGLSDNLLRRAADVILKEKRRLIIVPREAPLSSIHLQHMLTLSNMGATIIPPQPAWYTNPKTIEDVEDHIVGRVLDMLGIHTEYKRWCGGRKSI